MATRVYKYRLWAPVENTEKIDEQISLAHRYYNTLVELERTRRKKSREVIGAAPSFTPELDAAVAELKAQLAEVRDRIKAERKKTRKRSEAPEDKALAAKLKIAFSAAIAKRKEARGTQSDPKVKEALTVIQDEFHIELKKARAINGVYWGTYLIIEAAIDAARKMPLWAKGEPAEPRFRRWRGEGAVAVQLIKGLDAAKFLDGTDTKIQLDPTLYPRGRKMRPRLRLRIGSGGSSGRDPIWGIWPIKMHRPLPPGAVIKWAKVIRTITAGKPFWMLHLTIEYPEGARACGEGRIAIDVGWRKIPEGIRVAYAIGDDGHHKELVVSKKVLDRFQKVSDLASIREKMLIEMRDGWFKAYTTENGPEWFIAEAQGCWAWRTPGRFCSLIWRWGQNRWDGDSEFFERALVWRKQERHLWQWQEFLRRKTLVTRRDIYRTFAAELGREYETLIIEKFDLRKIAKKGEVEDPSENETSRHSRQLASISELRKCLELGFTSRGGQMIEVDAAYTTKACHACGAMEEWDQAADLLHGCACGVVWDQDENAARNLLKLGRETPAVTHEERPSKWRGARKQAAIAL